MASQPMPGIQYEDFVNVLEAAGYNRDNVQASLNRQQQNDSDWLNLRELYEADDRKMMTILRFSAGHDAIRYSDGIAFMMHVPMAHGIVNGVHTKQLEDRMGAINWRVDYPWLRGIDPENPLFRETEYQLAKVADDLYRLHQGSPAGAVIAEMLTEKYLAWDSIYSGHPFIRELTKQYETMTHLPELTTQQEIYGFLSEHPVIKHTVKENAQGFFHDLKATYPLNQILKEMNLNNLENLREELKTLGFTDKTISEMEKNMEKGVPEFTLNEKIAATRGQIDLTLHFKQSGQSEHYFFNKFDVAHNIGKPLEEGQKYIIITPNEAGKNMTKSFENVTEAITFFKDQKSNSELAVGTDAAHREKLATMENGKVNYVAKDFQRTFRAPAVTQTFWIERGRGFTAEQAANLIQGRSVYRDDLLNLGGQPYKAWIKLDMDTPKDRHQNFLTNQYHDPSYGFNLEKVLDKFQIKELNEPTKKEALENTLKNGNRPLITTVKEGQEVKMFIEAVPRYSQVNLYREDGKPEKREQFLKQPLQEQMLQIGKAKGQAKEQEQGMRI
jgi:hypothetical protein